MCRFNTLWGERILKACTNCESASTEKAIVRPVAKSPICLPKPNAVKLSTPISAPSNPMRMASSRPMTLREPPRPCMVSGSTPSSPRAMAGKESVSKFTHSSWMGSSGVGKSSTMAKKIVTISPILLESRKWTVFLMF